MMRGALVASLAVVASAALAGAQQAGRVSVTHTLEPPSVLVGMPTLLHVRVVAPPGTRVRFPSAVDSAAGIEPVDPVTIREEPVDAGIAWIGTYRLVAWETGELPITLGPIEHDAGGVSGATRLRDAVLEVQSVLPADTSLRTPRPARDIVALPPPGLPWWLYTLIGALIAILGGWWLQRRADRPVPRVPPERIAHRALEQLRSLELIAAGEPARHVVASADILREYFATRDPEAAVGLTSRELVAHLRGDDAVPAHRVLEVLHAADAVKFAGYQVDPGTAEFLAKEADAIVDEVRRLDARGERRK